MSLYEVVTEDGLMRPAMDARKDGSLYCGGGAAMVERALGLNGDEILYVGDHIYTDAALAKLNFRWAVLTRLLLNFGASVQAYICCGTMLCLQVF